ncbi:MAG: hypothetical protein KAT58_03935 [candidate division Zixibacteria bacterium]|nr:hypothetical protein [candidate division Zixibacteria bacterium]
MWHILKEKDCYPEGCISFDWKCRKFDQRRKCPRKKKHVGRDCFSCQFFYEEKYIFQPELLVTSVEFDHFRQRLADFEEWVDELQNRPIEVRGKIASVLPLLAGRQGARGLTLSCRGILLYFKEGIFRYDRFRDPFYARLSFNAYDRIQVSVDDEIDFTARLQIDRGRFLFIRVGSVEIVRPGDGEPIPAREIRQAKFTGSFIDGQPGKCLRCVYGMLIDDTTADGRSRPRRFLYCTRGVADYRFCPYRE